MPDDDLPAPEAPDARADDRGATPRAVVVTVSTRAAEGVYDDAAGPALADQLREAGFTVAPVRVVPDGRGTVADELRAALGDADLVITTGGTGLHPRDETPEATVDVVDRTVPGIAEAMRAAALRHTPMGMLSRATAGVAGRTLIVNLPGSPKGAVENLSAVLDVLGHAIDQLRGGDHPR
jgi:molybdenum cofactor biosynthesis protein B